MTVYAKMTGDRRLTLDELRALQAIAERGWDAMKLDGAREIPYGPAPLTERACRSIIGALEKVDRTLKDAELRSGAEGAPRPPFQLRESTFLPLLDGSRKPLSRSSPRGGGGR